MFDDLEEKLRQFLQKKGPTWYASTWFPESLSAKQQSLLLMLASANRNRIKVEPLIYALALENRGRYRRILFRLHHKLEQGIALVDALEQIPDSLPDEQVLALRLGIQSGMLTETYEQFKPQSNVAASNLRKEIRRNLTYWLAIAICVVLNMTLLFGIIFPVITRVFNEFAMQASIPYVLLGRTVESFNRYAFLWIIALVVFTWMLLSSSTRRWFRRRWAPYLSNSINQLRRIELFEMLGLAVERGRPLAGVLSTLARYHFDKSLRQQLLFARNEVEQGTGVWESMSRANLITSSQADALVNSTSPELVGWTLRKIGSTRRTIRNQFNSYMIQLIQPLVILFFGFIVLWITGSLMTALFSLITALT